jgi:hypothetical protein
MPYPSGWPDNAAFRSFLGLDPADVADTDATQLALDAAQVDAVEVGKDPADPILTARDCLALFQLARLHLNSRNQPESYWSSGNAANDRQTWRQLLAGTNIGAT